MTIKVDIKEWRESSEAILHLAELLHQDVEIRIPGKKSKEYFVSIIYNNVLIMDIGFNTEEDAIEWLKNNNKDWKDCSFYLRSFNSLKEDFDVYELKEDVLIGEVHYENI